MTPTKASENPMVKNKLEATVELLKDFIVSEPLGQAVIKFQKMHPELCEWDSVGQEYKIWRLICKKAAQKIMEEIHRIVGGDLSKLDDTIVDQAINRVLETANQKVARAEHDAIFFTLTNHPLPPKHPLSSSQNGTFEKFNLFGENEIIPADR